MNASKTNTAELVNRGLELKATIAKAEAELKIVTAALQNVALAFPEEHIPLVDSDRQGTRWLADNRLPIIFESDQIIGTFTAGAACETAMRSALTGAPVGLESFYREKRVFECLPRDGKAFRTLAHQMLGAAAPAFIFAATARDKSGAPKTRVVIDWDAAKTTDT